MVSLSNITADKEARVLTG